MTNEEIPEFPDIIKTKICKLKRELETLENDLCTSINYHKYKQICTQKYDKKDIVVFHNIGQLREILEYLYAGKKIQYRHVTYGPIDIEMNPQKNRLLVSEHFQIKENNIIEYMMTDLEIGTWWVETDYY